MAKRDLAPIEGFDLCGKKGGLNKGGIEKRKRSWKEGGGAPRNRREACDVWGGVWGLKVARPKKKTANRKKTLPLEKGGVPRFRGRGKFWCWAQGKKKARQGKEVGGFFRRKV